MPSDKDVVPVEAEDIEAIALQNIAAQLWYQNVRAGGDPPKLRALFR